MPKPDFFIVGAPKCGTTALYEYLKQHPQVFLPRKEIYFFGQDFHFRHPRPNLDFYQSLFKAATQNQYSGDASVWYLYSKKAAQEIKQFNPKAKIIIMLRSPVDMLYSLHSQQLYAGNETLKKFEDALNAEAERRKGAQIPPLISCPYEGLYYSEVARFSAQVKRYYNAFPSNQIYITFFSDFIKNTALIYDEILDFLGLIPYDGLSFKNINSNKKVKSQFFRNMLKVRPQWLIYMAKVLLPNRNLRTKVIEKLWSFNTTYAPRQAINEDTKKRLHLLLKDDIMELEKLLDKDLKHWYSI